MKLVSRRARAAAGSARASLPRLRSQPIHRVLARIEDPAAVQQQEAIPSGCRPVALVQLGDAGGGQGEQWSVRVQDLLGLRRRRRSARRSKGRRRRRRGSGPRAAQLCSSSSASPVSRVGTATRVRSEAGTPDVQFEARQWRRPEARGDGPVDERGAVSVAGMKPATASSASQLAGKPGEAIMPAPAREQRRRNQQDRAGIAADAEADADARRCAAGRRARKPIAASNASRPPPMR